MAPPSSAPTWGNALTRRIAAWLLKILGWRIEADFPDLPRLVLAAAPHTSNWDGVIGVSAIVALGLRINWFAKDTLFRWPFRGVLLWLGGVPIKRDKARGIVEQTTDIFRQREKIYVVIAPEGTRARAPVWKTGFYRIAHATQTPILLAYVDYSRKVVGTGPLIQPSGDYAADLRRIQDFYRGKVPRRPDKFAAEG